MAIPAAVIAAGITAAGSGATAYGQGRMNKKNRAFSKEMYERQRQDALADWDRVNEYNSPLMQMKRFKEAGLNPALIYGETNNAPAVRSSEFATPRTEAPQIDTASAVNAFYDTRMREAQTDNIKAATQTAQQDALLRAAQIVATAAQTTRTGVQTDQDKFNLEQAKNLQGVVLETAAEELRKKKADTQFTLDENERKAAQSASGLLEAAQRIASMRIQNAKTQDERREIQARIDNLLKDGKLKQLDINLKKDGIQPSDNIFLRVLGQLINGKSTLQDVPERALKQMYKNYGVDSTKKRWFEK